MGTQNDLIELGLVKQCPHIVVTEIRGQLIREPCGAETIQFGGLCSRHDNTAELVRQERNAKERTVLRQRRYIEETLFPKLTERIEAIIDNDEAKDADVIKIWQTTMDRIGLAAVQGLVVEGTVKADAPLDILKAMLRPSSTAEIDDEEDIVDAEVV